MENNYRRMAGYQKGPCPACGKGERHPAGSVCFDCRSLIEDGRKRRAEIATSLAADEISEHRIPRCHYELPYIRYGAPEDFQHEKAEAPGSGCGRSVQLAFYELVAAIGRPTKNYEVSMLIQGSQGYNPAGCIALPSKVAKILVNLWDSLMANNKAAYDAGVKHGQNLLAELASGEITVKELNEQSRR